MNPTMQMAQTTQGRRKLADHMVSEIRRLIAAGAFQRGSRLPTERELAERFDVGRSSVREAVRVLSHMGEVEVRHGEGTFVRPEPPAEDLETRLGRARLADLYEARQIIEVQTAALAAQRRSQRDVAAMRKTLKERRAAQQTGDARGYLLADFAFHTAIAKASKNVALFELYRSFVSVLVVAFDGSLGTEELKADTDLFHERLCDAIEQRDAARAVRISRKHLSTSLARLNNLL